MATAVLDPQHWISLFLQIEPGLSLSELETVRMWHSLNSEASQHQLTNQELSVSAEICILVSITWYMKDPSRTWLWKKWARWILQWTCCVFFFCSGSNCRWINQHMPYKCRESEFLRFLISYCLYAILCRSPVVLCLWLDYSILSLYKSMFSLSRKPERGLHIL